MTAVAKTTHKPKGRDWRAFLFERPKKDYWHPYLGGLLLGLVLFTSFFLTGNGLE